MSDNKKPRGPKIPSYLPGEARLAAKLNAMISGGDTLAYRKLTRLAVRAIRHGRWHREGDHL